MSELHTRETDPCELLRQQMETQIQRLKSLATTARAVTTLGSLEDVLRVICTQAQELLSAAQASINLPVAGDAAVTCIMATDHRLAHPGRRQPERKSAADRAGNLCRRSAS